MAAQFIESVSESSNSLYYVFTGETLPFADDNAPPAPADSTFGVHNDVYDNILFGKKIVSDDVKHMIRRVNWVSSNTYSAYSYTGTTLETDNFYAISEESGNYAVFKCLDNNGGAAATDKPLFSETSADDEFYQTTDKYVWKLMYNISAADWAKFATNDFAPVIPNANVSANAVSGSIEAVIINSGGAKYNAYANGTFKEVSVAGNTLIHGLESSSVTLSANTDFYKNSTLYVRSGTGAGQARDISEYIVTGSERRVLINPAFTTVPDTSSVFEIGPGLTIKGDGDDAVVVATIDTTANSISTIEVVNRGSGYSFADIIISSNGDSITAANLTPSLSPPGGHGSDVVNELYASRAGISVTYANNESNTIPTTNDYRSVGILKDPLFANVELTLTTSTASSFLDGETVIHYVPQSSNTLLRSYTYTLSRYQTLTVNTSTLTGFTAGNKISADTKGGMVIASGSAANTINVRLNEGSAAFAATDFIGNNTITEAVSSVTAANPAVVATVNAHGLSNGANVSFHGLNGTNLDDDASPTTYYAKTIDATSFSVYTDAGLAVPFNNSSASGGVAGFVTNGKDVLDINVVAYAHTGNNDPIIRKDDANNAFGFSSNLPLTSIVKRNNLVAAHTTTSTTFTLTDITLVPASDVITIEIYTNTETVTLPDYIGRTTAEVSNRAGDVLRLRNIRGDFATGYKVKGLTSGIVAEIEAIDRSFSTFNQLTEMAVQIVDAGTGDTGVANTGFTIDQFVTQDQGIAGPVQAADGTTYAHGTVFAVSNTITRFVSSITAANPAVVTTTVAHGYSNGQVLAFRSLNGSTFANTVPTYYAEIKTTTSFYVTSDAALTTRINNSANTAASTGTIIASGIGSIGASAYRTFFLSNVKGIFGISDDASATVNTFVSNTSSGGTGASAKITSRIDGDLVDNSGEVIYKENISPVARSNDQSEKVRIILEF